MQIMGSDEQKIERIKKDLIKIKCSLNSYYMKQYISLCDFAEESGLNRDENDYLLLQTGALLDAQRLIEKFGTLDKIMNFLTEKPEEEQSKIMPDRYSNNICTIMAVGFYFEDKAIEEGNGEGFSLKAIAKYKLPQDKISEKSRGYEHN